MAIYLNLVCYDDEFNGSLAKLGLNSLVTMLVVIPGAT